MTIHTDDLIRILAHAPKRPTPFSVLMAALAVILAGWATTYFMLGLRTDISQFPVGFWLKTAWLALAAFIACLTLKAATTPLPSLHSARAIAAITVGLFLSWLAWEWTTQPLTEILSLFSLPNFPNCLKYSTLYGVAGLMGLTWAAQQYAPANAAKAGLNIGFCAALCAGLGYSIHCPIDSPTFILVAYGLPAAFLSLAGYVLLPRFLRW